MAELSFADFTQSPPIVAMPRSYNAAYDLIARNLIAGRADKIAFIEDNSQLTYGELADRVASFASALRAHGIEPEHRILICLHDCIDWPVAFLGAIQAGVIPVPVNTLLTADDYEYMLQDSHARVAVVSASLMPRFLPLLQNVASLATLIVSGGDKDNSFTMEQFMAAAGAPVGVAPTTRDDICFWLYSSGSTGRPKGTVHVHSSLMFTANYYACPILGIQESDVTGARLCASTDR
jgi:benzoate-CoA ligase